MRFWASSVGFYKASYYSGMDGKQMQTSSTNGIVVHCDDHIIWLVVGHPSEKYESQLGWLETQYMGK